MTTISSIAFHFGNVELFVSKGWSEAAGAAAERLAHEVLAEHPELGEYGTHEDGIRILNRASVYMIPTTAFMWTPGVPAAINWAAYYRDAHVLLIRCISAIRAEQKNERESAVRASDERRQMFDRSMTDRSEDFMRGGRVMRAGPVLLTREQKRARRAARQYGRLVALQIERSIAAFHRGSLSAAHYYAPAAIYYATKAATCAFFAHPELRTEDSRG
jgi:hypothetical protein